MFNLRGNERLTEWRRLRDNLQTSNDPHNFALEIWKHAPLVSPYLDPDNPESWPDPWHLILDDRYDDLALALGIVYTLGLSERFMTSKFEIHTSMRHTEEENFFVINEDKIIDVGYRIIRPNNYVFDSSVKRIWSYQFKS